MGYFSDKDLEEWEIPNIQERDTAVCDTCVVDDALAELVNANLEFHECSYCGKSSTKPCAASFNLVMQRIYEAITTTYVDAQDIDLPWVEGGWITEEIYAHDIVMEFNPDWDDKFTEDVINSLDPSVYWTKHSHGDWAISDPSDTLSYGWEGFKNQVLTKTRYLFLNEPVDETEIGRPDYLPMGRMLDALGNLVRDHSLLSTLDSGTSLYRVRACSGNKHWKTFEELGLPPMGAASAGRMNPPGIPYFYVTLDSDTAISEVINKPTKYSLARFQTKKHLRLVNFVDLPDIPSVFLPEKYDKRHQLYFLYMLLDDIKKPISKDGGEHVEYVPTQIVSEYFRYRFLDNEENEIDGFMYPSVKNPGGINVAMFVSSNELLTEKCELMDIQNF